MSAALQVAWSVIEDAAPDVPPGVAAEAFVSTRPVPVAIDGLFGWFHPGPGLRGVVLCGAHGFEQMAAHRPWRRLADAIAASGCPTLRFDYPGEGDSADPDELQLADWVGAIRRAVRYLRDEAGAEEITLVGLRFGATLAALAARAEPVERLVLLAPFATGRAYLREMRLRAQSIDRMPNGSTPPQVPDRLSVGGYRFGPGLVSEIGQIDLAAADRRPAPHILLLTAEPGAPGRRYAALGSNVTTAPFPGLSKLVGDPIFAETPDDDFATVVSFVVDGLDADGIGHRPPRIVGRHPDVTGIAGPGWSEEPARFGRGLFGILCRPDRTDTGAPTVVFVSTGMTVHSGWGRQTTLIARSLAREGIASLRFDLTGIGDSEERRDGASPIYATDAEEDVRLAVEHVARRSEGPIVLVGTCSGAYAAFKALCHEPRVDGALLVNLYCFDWDPEQSIDAILRETHGSASDYAALLRHGSTWRRLLGGEIHVRAIALAIGRRIGPALRRRFRRLMRDGLGGPSVRRRIARLRARGVTLRLLYSEGDPGLAALRRHLGRSPERVARVLGQPVEIVSGTDHNLSTHDAQDRLAAQVRDLVRTVTSRPRFSCGARA